MYDLNDTIVPVLPTLSSMIRMAPYIDTADDLSSRHILSVMRSLISQISASSYDLQAIGQCSVYAVPRLIRGAGCEIRLRQRDESLRLISSVGLSANYRQHWVKVPLKSGDLYEQAIKQQQGYFVNDSMSLTAEDQQRFAQAHARSVAVVPLCIRKQVLGVITIVLAQTHVWSESEHQRLELLANVTALAISHALTTTREQRLQQQKDDVLIAISHELRTPLTSVQGYLELIERKLHQHPVDQLDQAIPQYLDVAIKQSHVLGETIDQLLDVALIEQERLVLIPTQIRPDVFVSSVIDDLRQRFAQRSFVADLPVASQAALWDAVRVRQIIQHLVKNAVMYSPQPAPIEIQMAYMDHTVQMAVRDYGQGIASDDQEHVFERFWRGVDNSLSKDVYGLGLGLYLSKTFANVHGGHLRVRSAGIIGQGSLFTLELPWQTPAFAN